MDGLLTGRLLVATPLLEEPNFRRAVVFVCAHNQDGAFGVVLNRPLEEPVAAQLPQWDGRAAAPRVLFSGGPVDPERVTALARDRSRASARAGAWDGAPGWTPVGPEVGLLDLTIEPAGLAPTIEAVRLFAGYAGWGGGQLEQEIGQDSWFVVDAAAGDPFTLAPRDLWRVVLRRQPSPLAIYSTFPADTALN
ncbi:MAG: DUF179 domain-containing protein [Dehalococcoidia bacterium]|nr:DUF179 domain-containing protein [Dehalococcoidia bacterium]